jgi:FkbM family methyltransferase
MKFYSQYGQDKWLYEHYFKNKKNGTFLEIGADDGIDKSNTYFFEQKLGWTGLCIEPSPSRFKLLKENRQCLCENIALSNKVGTEEFLDIQGWGKGLSGLMRNYSDQHSHRIENELTHVENQGSHVITVKTELLNNILEKHQLRHIDFCTIDTEGSEFDILEQFDFNTYVIDILLVENNYNQSNVKDLLFANGYQFIDKLEIDDVYKKTIS